MNMRRNALTLFVSLIMNNGIIRGENLQYSKTNGPKNLGVLVHNSEYTIYRSSRLGKSGLKKVDEYLKENNLPFPKTVIYMNRNGYTNSFPFFSAFATQEYELKDHYGYNFYHSFDKENPTYVDGRNPYNPSKSIHVKKYYNNKAEKIFDIEESSEIDGGIENFMRVMKIVLNKENSPVLFHCTGGMHRTGMVALAIRYLQGGEWITGAKKKVFIRNKFKTLELNPAQYEYALHNKWLFRTENLDFIEAFSKSEEFSQLKDLYSSSLLIPNQLIEGIYAQDNGVDSLDSSRQERDEHDVLTIQID